MTAHEIYCPPADFAARWSGARRAAIVPSDKGIRVGDTVRFGELFDERDDAHGLRWRQSDRAIIATVTDVWDAPTPAMAGLSVLSFGGEIVRRHGDAQGGEIERIA
jgi:hypothetical protein